MSTLAIAGAVALLLGLALAVWLLLREERV